MNPRANRLLQMLLAAALAVPGLGHADWVASSDLAAIRPAPGGMALQAQNPPSFTWSRHPSNNASYTLEITRSGAAPLTFTTNRNWFLPTTRLAAGTYAWRVRPTSSTEWSTPRSFVISSGSTVFEVPANEVLRARVLAHGRSRALAPGFQPASAWSVGQQTERTPALKRLVDDVVGHTPMKALSDAEWPLPTTAVMTAALSAQNTDIRQRIGLVGHQAEAAALLFRLTRNAAYLNEALARGDQMAALAVDGATSYKNQDQATRQIAMSLARTVDFLWNDIDPARRARWLDVIRKRTAVIYADLASNDGKLDQFPFDSHGSTALGFVAEIATLTLGDIPEAQQWFDFTFRTYVHSVSVWSGAEGGYANGTAYGQVSIDLYMRTWGTLAQASGINLYDKPWAAGFLRFFMHFVPPGAKNHLFGDGHEDVPAAGLLKAYASRFANPEAKWYYNALSGNEDALTLLSAPMPLPVNTVTAPATPPANAALYPSIGWVAMHSSLSDPNRTSLYFKSSPFGSYNHSHGDQNSIVLSSGGKPLLIETGYYDWYGSPLWNDWYRQTKAHNAVTFDGGIGQPVSGNNENLARRGRISAFQTTSALDYAEGEATAAYGGALTQATRKVWYLRNQNAAVVMDSLASATARAFEWNLHAPVPITAVNDSSVRITNGDRTLCVRSLGAGAKYAPRTGAPRPNVVEAHGAFVLPAARSAEFLVLLDIGCRNPAASLTSTSSGRQLKIGDQVLLLPK